MFQSIFKTTVLGFLAAILVVSCPILVKAQQNGQSSRRSSKVVNPSNANSAATKRSSQSKSSTDSASENGAKSAKKANNSGSKRSARRNNVTNHSNRNLLKSPNHFQPISNKSRQTNKSTAPIRQTSNRRHTADKPNPLTIQNRSNFKSTAQTQTPKRSTVRIPTSPHLNRSITVTQKATFEPTPSSRRSSTRLQTAKTLQKSKAEIQQPVAKQRVKPLPVKSKLIKLKTASDTRIDSSDSIRQTAGQQAASATDSLTSRRRPQKRINQNRQITAKELVDSIPTTTSPKISLEPARTGKSAPSKTAMAGEKTKVKSQGKDIESLAVRKDSPTNSSTPQSQPQFSNLKIQANSAASPLFDSKHATQLLANAASSTSTTATPKVQHSIAQHLSKNETPVVARPSVNVAQSQKPIQVAPNLIPPKNTNMASVSEPIHLASRPETAKPASRQPEVAKVKMPKSDGPTNPRAFNYVPSDFVPRITKSPFAQDFNRESGQLAANNKIIDPSQFLMKPAHQLSKTDGSSDRASVYHQNQRQMRKSGQVAFNTNFDRRRFNLQEDGATQEEADSMYQANTPKTDEQAAEDEANRRAKYISELHQPMSTMPAQMAVSYVDSDGSTLKKQPDASLQWIQTFDGYAYLPVSQQPVRHDANSGFWYEQYAAWSSPNFRHRPLYFEDRNLERYGASKGRIQPFSSAVHFFVSTLHLPYNMGADDPCVPQYAIGHGRPGNQYCLNKEKLVWSRRGASFQALLIAAGIWGLP